MCCLQAFDTAQRELGIAPVMTGEDLVSCAVPDKLTMVAYLSQFYELFKHEPLPSSEYPASTIQFYHSFVISSGLVLRCLVCIPNLMLSVTVLRWGGGGGLFQIS